MSNESYQSFWEKLAPHYLISKGEMRLPIVSELIALPDFNEQGVLQELRSLLQQLLDTEGTEEGARQRAQNAGDEHFLSLITPEYTGVVRFDCVWQPETGSVKVLEINCDYPDGLLLHDATYGTLDQNTCTLHTDLFSELFTPNEPIHILYSDSAGFLDSYYTEHKKLQEKGFTCSIGNDPTEVPAHTTVRRCLETTKLTKEGASSLTRSDRFINTLALRTLGYKDLLEQLTHDFIPKTTRLTPDTTDYVYTEQDRLVLKPADGCEGFGIYFGNQFKPEEWQQLTDTLVGKNYIAQELVTIPKQAVPLYDAGAITKKELYFDLCPHFFIKNGQVIGDGHILMRYSENPVVNVTQGGGIGYYKR